MTVLPDGATEVVLRARPFRLTSGEMLPEVRVAVQTWGHPTGDNAVLVCHALTGDADAASWWRGVVGPGRALDPEHHFIIGMNILGGCRGTTGPLSLDPRTGRPYGLSFPDITVQDIVAVEAAALKEMGVGRLHLVAGGSLGGMQALAWALLYPAQVDHVLVAAAPWASPPLAIAWNAIGRQAILHDPDFLGGARPGPGRAPRGLAIARMVAMTTYRSHENFHLKFSREETGDDDPVARRLGPYATEVARNSRFAPRFAAETYLHYQGEKLVRRFDAFTYLYLTQAMDLFDAGLLVPDEPAASDLPNVMCLSVSSDILYPPTEVARIGQELERLGYPVEVEDLQSPHGHDAFLIEGDAVGRAIGRLVATRPALGSKVS